MPVYFDPGMGKKKQKQKHNVLGCSHNLGSLFVVFCFQNVELCLANLLNIAPKGPSVTAKLNLGTIYTVDFAQRIREQQGCGNTWADHLIS